MYPIAMSHQPFPVMLSIAIAMIASYVVLHLIARMNVSGRRLRNSSLVVGALTFGSGLWAMHYTDMLTIRLPFRTDYDGLLVALSLLSGVVSSAASIPFLASRHPGTLRLVAGSLLLGLGLTAVQFVGMASQRMPAHFDCDTLYFGESVLLSGLACFVALRLAFLLWHPAHHLQQAAAGAIVGAAVSGLHYVWINNLTLYVDTPVLFVRSGPLYSSLELFVVIAALAFVLAALAGLYFERMWLNQAKLLQDREMRIESLFRYSQDAVFSFSLTGRLLDVNEAAERMTGYPRQLLTKMIPRSLIAPEYHDETRANFIATVAGQSLNFDSAIFNRTGERVEVNNTNVPVIVDGRVVGVYTIVRDITERKLTEAAMNHMAHHDALTDLPNRRLFEVRLNRALAEPAADDGSIAVLFLDIDRFKIVNDSMGHDYGDLLLKEVASRLLGCIDSGSLVARMGGDEFAVLLTGRDVRARAAEVAQQFIARIDRPFTLRGKDFHITTSIGIAVYPEDGRTLIGLMRNADTALYSAKANGKNTYRFYSPVMNEQLSETMLLEADLRKALERNEFFLQYQPQIDIATGRLVGVEALLRWKHGKKGLMSPDTFIPIAEETGIIVQIGEWVLRAACEQHGRWQAEGLPPIRMAVNLSSRQFLSPYFADIIRRILEETGMEASLLDLEITESMTLDIDRSTATLVQLKAIGVNISIDDFGTGYSSLHYLKSFPVDCLKIDQSFVRAMVDDANDRSIVSTIVSLAHNLKLRVLAEGVETEEQLAILAFYGCDEMQGYLASRPVAPDAIPALVHRIHFSLR